MTPEPIAHISDTKLHSTVAYRDVLHAVEHYQSLAALAREELATARDEAAREQRAVAPRTCSICGVSGTEVGTYERFVGGHGWTDRVECTDSVACWARFDTQHRLTNTYPQQLIAARVEAH